MAHSGTVKPAISSRTPNACTCLYVTGIVAAEEEVPSAVKYAGSMVPSIFSGFWPDTAPAMPNCISNTTSVMIKIRMIILANTASTAATCPAEVIFKKMPKIYSGSSGIITAEMTL